MTDPDRPKTSGSSSVDARADTQASSSARIAIVTLKNAAQVGHRVAIDAIQYDDARAQQLYNATQYGQSCNYQQSGGARCIVTADQPKRTIMAGSPNVPARRP